MPLQPIRFMRVHTNAQAQEHFDIVECSVEEQKKKEGFYDFLRKNGHVGQWIGTQSYDLWSYNPETHCKRYKYKVYYGDGVDQMVSAGKFKDYGCDKNHFRKVDENSRSQQIQMASGQTQWRGTIFIRLKQQDDLNPDITFFKDSPMGWINSRWFAESWSKDTKNKKYGKEVARLRSCLGVKTRLCEMSLINYEALEKHQKNPMFYTACWIEPLDDSNKLLDVHHFEWDAESGSEIDEDDSDEYDMD
jgi:hypothetical protein